MRRPIGVFDSGLGGISTLKQLINIMPHENFIYFGDSQFAPYGVKPKEEVVDRCKSICEFFLTKNVKAIVIACNTATSVAAPILRELYPSIPILGLEPAIKVATSNTHNSNIVVMATPLTLKELKFKTLVNKYQANNNIIKLPCPELVEIVENGLLEESNLVLNQLDAYFSNIDLKSIDSVVLGCTHFIFFKNYLTTILNDTTEIIDGNLGVAKNLYNILNTKNLLSINTTPGTVSIYNSSNDLKQRKLAYDLLNFTF